MFASETMVKLTDKCLPITKKRTGKSEMNLPNLGGAEEEEGDIVKWNVI